MRTAQPVEFEFDEDTDDAAGPYLVRKVPILDGAGTVVRIVTISLDISERKRLERDLLQAQKMESVDRLAGGIAHDFNNMLTAIMGYAELGERAAQPGENTVVSSFQGIQKAAERASHLTRQLLTFARGQPIRPTLLSLNDLVFDMDHMLRRLIGEDIELVTLTSDAPLTVKVDRGQMEQVLTNLALNARDAMPQGGKLTIETADVGLENVMLSVTDTGTGMTEEVRSHIFEPFYTTKEVASRSGLGLSSCYGIVTQNGGQILVDSAPGEGTTIKIVLPVAGESADPPPRDGEPNNLHRGTETVLLVEDEPTVRDMASRVLRDQGYTVLEAANGIDALSVADWHSGEPIHLLLTDIIMPLMGGRETADQFRKLRPEMKVLFTSGYQEDSEGRPGSQMPASTFLPKPFTPATLVDSVRAALHGP